MSKTRSIDNLKTDHLHFCKSVEAQLPNLPEFLAEQKNALCVTYAEIVNASKSRTLVGVRKTTDLALRTAWTQRADKALARARLRIRADAPDNFREYFPENNGAACRKIDRWHAVDRALTVSEHFGHAHLGSFKDELETLKTEGIAIFEAASASVTEQKAQVENLKELKSKWERQYQKLKMLFRSHYYGTSTDWAMFFYEKREARNGSGRENGRQFAVAEPPSASLAS